ncbi:MAG: DUF4959 domain-containing protein [Prevotellaceae bacterium]|jgi:hypothetical protein|nr:DUF4959 domain-containing protein [Prevotellaceae bacterium]
MTTKKFLLISSIVCLFFCASCSEENRYDINSEDTVQPGAPVISRYEPLNGAVRIFYTPPKDNDVISIDALYKRQSDGKAFRFSTSYFSNSILIPGLIDTINYDVELYAVDRAGNHSSKIVYPVKPRESAISKVKSSMSVKGGFDAVFLKWTNELKAPANVFVDYTFTMNNTSRTLTRVFSSTTRDNRYYITDLAIPEDSPVKVRFRVSDEYENFTEYSKDTTIFVLKDVEVPKLDPDRTPYWSIPPARTIPLVEDGSNISQVFGDVADGKMGRVIDGLIDQSENLNYMMTEEEHPWSLIIDLKRYYQLSRIVTHQRHTRDGGADEDVKRGNYYRQGNIGQYRMYRWDEEEKKWELISYHKIDIPQGTLSELEWNKLGRAGDMAYMYPDDPKFTKPTRWFRYEALSGFDDNYASGTGGSLSEITLYCKETE